jgi:NAD(P)-dependent dehydrogenase (short-subunit alcohol dehydrogenase family)
MISSLISGAHMSGVFLVTGGSRGIGAAAARLAAERGYDVALTYIGRKDAADAMVVDIQRMGRRALAVQCDVADPVAIANAFDAVHRAFGRLDAFFNNAGILWPHSRFVDITAEQLSRTIAVNLSGPFHANQHAIRRMSTRFGGKGGAIVNMSSMAAKLGGAFECVDYAVSKGGIESMTIGLAKEHAAEGVRVNGVRPGIIETDIHASAGDPGRVARIASSVPIGRGGSAQEVAETVLWLCSPQASYVTGVTIDVAGGRGI